MFPEATAFHFFSVSLLEKSVGLLLLCGFFLSAAGTHEDNVHVSFLGYK